MKDKKDGSVNISSVDGVALMMEQGGQSNHVVNATILQELEVIAPSDLAEGYQFEVVHDGQRFVVTVPTGGVKTGQQFKVEAALVETNGQRQRWSTDLCDCFRFGCCHPHVCLAFWCQGIALAQVMTRMRLTWLGGPGSVQQVASTFKTVAGIFLVCIAVDYALVIAMYTLAPSFEDTYDFTNDEVSYTQESQDAAQAANVVGGIRRLWEFIFGMYFLVATIRTRMAVRAQHNIDQEACGGIEDCCCSYWCRCCVTTQMMRQTADYERQPAACCTETGLARHVDPV